MSKNTQRTVGFVVLEKGQHQEHFPEGKRLNEEWESFNPGFVPHQLVLFPV